jgi:hypothetical protein
MTTERNSERILYLDPLGGIAGDMFLAALLDAGALQIDDLRADLAALGPLGFTLRAARAERGGVTGTHLDVEMQGEQPHERSWKDIRALLQTAPLRPAVRERALRIFTRIAEAEGRAHGKPAEEIHFHEVGAVDSIVDVVGAACALDRIGATRLVTRPPPMGRGTTRSAHGVIPIPPPAVVEILKGRKVASGGDGERTTPTGAAIVTEFDEAPQDAMPPMRIRATGYGCGTKEWTDVPNVLRAVLGEADAAAPGAQLTVLEANLDDASPQIVAWALEQCLAAGALDAWVVAAVYKKGRPGHVVSALVDAAARARVSEVLFRETTTLGVRVHPVEREAAERELREVETPYGRVRVKLARRGDALLNIAPEYDDCAARAREKNVPLKEVIAAALAAARAAR